MVSVLSRIGAVLLPLLYCVSLQAATPNLEVYTYDSFTSDWGPGSKVKAAFEAKWWCTLERVGLSDGVAMLNRLKLEGANSRGDILLGIDTDRAVAERPVSILFQQHNLFPHLDLYANVALGIELSMRLAPGQVESVREALARLGLESMQGRKPGELSRGQRQRVALARTAFICGGRVAALAPTAQLLADSEPPQLREYPGSK